MLSPDSEFFRYFGSNGELPAANPRNARYVAPDRVVLDMAASPTIYGFGAVETLGTRSFRRLRAGRSEALAYARVNPDHRHELQLSVINMLDQSVLRDLSVGVFGSPATRLPDLTEGDRRFLRVLLPAEATRRFNGWLELTLSIRGAAAWQTNVLDATATGPQLQVERIDLIATR